MRNTHADELRLGMGTNHSADITTKYYEDHDTAKARSQAGARGASSQTSTVEAGGGCNARNGSGRSHGSSYRDNHLDSCGRYQNDCYDDFGWSAAATDSGSCCADWGHDRRD
jgi:hypothetical protein